MASLTRRILPVLLLPAALLASANSVWGQLRYPLSAAADESGTVYVADRELHGVWQIQKNVLTKFYEGSAKYRTPLNAVRCVTFDAQGRLLAGDSATREIYRFAEDGKPTPLTQGEIGIPMDVVVNPAGDLLVSDLELQRIFRIPGGKGKPVEVAEVAAPRGLFLDAEERLWVVSGGSKNPLLRVSADGEVSVVVSGRPFQFPHDVVVDGEGTAYVSDGYGKTIWKIADGGQPEAWVSGAPLANPVGLAWQGENILAADSKAKAVFRIDPAGQISPLPIQQP